MADFGASELDAFRTEVRDWLAANYPAELKDPKSGSDPEAVWGGQAFVGDKGAADPQIHWMRRMAEKGWTAPA
ncbi:MAG TPA: acyl-CoA dehydrogenase, partial [Phenylobacterium sp.]